MFLLLLWEELDDGDVCMFQTLLFFIFFRSLSIV